MVKANYSWMREGDMVELEGLDSGYEGGWFRVIIKELSYDKKGSVVYPVKVEYPDFEEKEGSEKRLIEMATPMQLRPMPPEFPNQRWPVREAVEGFWRNAWWIGFIRRFNSTDETYLVFFGHDQEDLVLRQDQIRARQEWVGLAKSSNGWRKVLPCEEPAPWEIQPRQQAQLRPRVPQKSRRKKYDSDDSWHEEDYTRKERQAKRIKIQKGTAMGTVKRIPANPRASANSGPHRLVISLAKPGYKPERPRATEVMSTEQPRAREQGNASLITPMASPAGSPQHIAHTPTNSDAAESLPSDAQASDAHGWEATSTSDEAIVDEEGTGHEEPSYVPSPQHKASDNYKAYLSVLRAFKADGDLTREQSASLEILRNQLKLSTLAAKAAYCEGLKSPSRLRNEMRMGKL